MIEKTNARKIIVWVAVVIVFGVFPVFLSRYHLDLLNFSAILAIGSLGVGLLMGQCGIINLGQVAFFGIGAYASAYCTTMLNWPVIVGLATGIAVNAVIAAVLGYPILRLRGFFLALATLALGSIAGVLFFEWDWLTGGSLGLGGIPNISLFGWVLNTPLRFYYFVWAVLALLLWLATNLVSGRPGLAMRAMRDSASAAEVLAVDIHGLQSKMFVLCAILGALAGSFYAHYVTYISVDSFTVERSIIFLLVPVIAGAHSVVGIIVGALFVTWAPDLLSKFGDFHQVIFGLLLVVVVTLLPNGLVGVVSVVRRTGESR